MTKLIYNRRRFLGTAAATGAVLASPALSAPRFGPVGRRGEYLDL